MEISLLPKEEGTIAIEDSHAIDVYCYDPRADQIATETGNFDQNLGPTDDDVQKALETLDELTSGATNHASLSNLDYANAGHTGFEPSVATGLNTQYYRGDKTWQTLNVAAVDGLSTQLATYVPYTGGNANLDHGSFASSHSRMTAPGAVINKSFIYSKDDFTVLLLHFDGADGSTTITDSSYNAHTMSVFGDAQIDTAQSVFGGSALLLDGTGDYVTTPTSTDLDLGANEFTIQCRFRLSVSSGTRTIVSKRDVNQIAWSLQVIPATGVVFAFSTNGTSATTRIISTTFSADTWYTLAVTRRGNTLTAYVNGSAVGSTAAIVGTIFNSTAPVAIGCSTPSGTPSSLFAGWIDELRIVNGRAVYTGTYTPEVAAFTADLCSTLYIKNGCGTEIRIGDVYGRVTGLNLSAVVFTDAYGWLTSTGIGTSAQFIRGDGSLTSVGTSSQFVKGDGSLDSSAYLTSVTAHALLSATHSDTTAATAVRGDLITGQGVSPTWSRLAKGTSGKFLQTDANDILWSAYTLPATVPTVGKILRSDGTNLLGTTLTIPDTITAGSVFAANSANVLSAVNSTSGTKYLKNVNGTISWDTVASGGSPGGTTGAVQFNNGSGFGGDATWFNWDNTQKVLRVGDIGITPTNSEGSILTGQIYNSVDYSNYDFITGSGHTISSTSYNTIHGGAHYVSTCGGCFVSGTQSSLEMCYSVNMIGDYNYGYNNYASSAVGSYIYFNDGSYCNAAVGNNLTFNSPNSSGVGTLLTLSGDSATSVGFGNTSAGYASLTTGIGCTANEYFDQAYGIAVTASGAGIGNADTNSCFAIGAYFTNSTPGSMSLGWGSEQLRFQLGKVLLYGLPTSSAGLSSGQIWKDSGVLKIV